MHFIYPLLHRVNAAVPSTAVDGLGSTDCACQAGRVFSTSLEDTYLSIGILKKFGCSHSHDIRNRDAVKLAEILPEGQSRGVQINRKSKTCLWNSSCQNSLQMNLMTSRSSPRRGRLAVYLSTSCLPTRKPVCQ